jgi:hypothetical protein
LNDKRRTQHRAGAQDRLDYEWVTGRERTNGITAAFSLGQEYIQGNNIFKLGLHQKKSF